VLVALREVLIVERAGNHRCIREWAIYRDMHSDLGSANCLRSVGDIYLEHNQYQVAREAYEAALVLYRARLAGCGKRVLEVPNDIAIALCDASTHVIITE
jgi:hypothetical protein